MIRSPSSVYCALILFRCMLYLLLCFSERADPNYCRDRITEGANINKSLVTLGIVISALGTVKFDQYSSQYTSVYYHCFCFGLFFCVWSVLSDFPQPRTLRCVVAVRALTACWARARPARSAVSPAPCPAAVAGTASSPTETLSSPGSSKTA